jgi:hypothetical protein
MLAFVVAPLVPAAIYIAETPNLRWLALLPVVVSYGHALLALCAYMWLRNTQRLSTGAMLAVSIVVGALPISWITATGIFASKLSGRAHVGAGDYADAGILILEAAGLGLAAGIVWRVIAGRPANYRIERRVNDKVPSSSVSARGAHAER